MSTTLPGIVMRGKLVQNWNAEFSMLVTPLETKAFVKLTQFSKALSPMVLMLAGIVMLGRLEHS